MREPDFAGLRTVAMKAARQPDFAEVELRAGRVRRRRWATSAGLAAVAVMLVAVGAGYALRGPRTVAPDPAGPPIPSSTRGVEPAGPPRRVISGYAGDANHLYAVTQSCDRPRECPWDLYGSDDAGLTWQGRTLPAEVLGPILMPRMLGPRTVVVDGYVSTDGGATWRKLEESAESVGAVLPDHKAVGCVTNAPTGPCIVRVLDPVTARVAALAHQPPIDAQGLWDTPPAAGLWVTGFDLDSDQPAVAWSHDSGQSWTTHVFEETDPVPTHLPSGFAPQLHTADGQTAYAMIHDDTATNLDPERSAGFARIYRTTDGGASWTLLRHESVPSYLGFVAGDGAHLLMIQGPLEYRASRDGGPYVLERMTGLQGFAVNPVPMAGGGYLTTVDEDRTAIYLSSDGLNWRRVPVQ